MTDTCYFEDFNQGARFESGSYTVQKEEAIDFALSYDPQAQHVDEEAAKGSMFGKLVISGWHTAAISMRLKLQTPLAKVHGGLVGMGLESVRWLKPVCPGDSLYVVITILQTRVSNSNPSRGVVKYKLETFNQEGVLVMELITAVTMPRKNAGK